MAPHPRYISRRMMRLIRLMIEFGSREYRSADEIYVPLGISRTQFYRDKAALEKMGFTFAFHRRSRIFAVDEDPGVKVEGLTLSEVLALILAVGRLPETGDFTLAWRALNGLRKIAVDRPGPAADFILAAVEEVVTGEGFGCSFEILESLVTAVGEKRRIHIVYGRPESEHPLRLNVDPHALVFKAGVLHLSASPEKGRRRLYRVAHLREVIPTPLLSPQ
ncbi:MAG: WYL domain-containing protein [Thermodesulfobacteriota bacterium]